MVSNEIGCMYRPRNHVPVDMCFSNVVKVVQILYLAMTATTLQQRIATIIERVVVLRSPDNVYCLPVLTCPSSHAAIRVPPVSTSSCRFRIRVVEHCTVWEVCYQAWSTFGAANVDRSLVPAQVYASTKTCLRLSITVFVELNDVVRTIPEGKQVV